MAGMDRLESMSMLVAAVEAGSFSAAARKLGVPSAAVSRKVSELEQRLRTRLVERSGRKLALTTAGRAYFAACERILDQVRDAERALTGEFNAPRGDLVITAPVVFGRTHVLPITVEFLRTYPEIDVRLLLTDRISNLVEENVDAAVRIGELGDTTLVAQRVGEVRRVVCGSPGYFGDRGTPKVPEALLHHTCITFEGALSPDAWTFESQTVAVRSQLVVSTADAAVDAALGGLGVTRVFSYQIEAAERTGALERVLGEFESKPVPVHVVHGSHSFIPLKLRAFLDFHVSRLTERVGSGAT
jgi:DNA-binding transcriptional LysR family regulator